MEILKQKSTSNDDRVYSIVGLTSSELNTIRDCILNQVRIAANDSLNKEMSNAEISRTLSIYSDLSLAYIKSFEKK